MAAFPATRPFFSPDDYLAWEDEQEVRHEYYKGEVFAMSGSTATHALITMNVGAALKSALRKKGCRIYSSDLKVQMDTEGTHFAYPDLSVVCGPPAFRDARGLVPLNPVLVVEVLSPSTEGYDRGRKFAAYRQIESLREVVLVAQEAPEIEVFRREADGRWTVGAPVGRGEVALASVGATFAVGDVYDGVDFPLLDPEQPAHPRRRPEA